jgi:hypothetical protein
MRPPLTPSVPTSITDQSSRITALERGTRPPPTMMAQPVVISAVGRALTTSTAAEHTVASSVLTVAVPTMLNEWLVDLDEAPSEPFSLALYDGVLELTSIVVPTGATSVRYRLPSPVLAQPTRALDIRSVGTVPGGMGYIAVQLLGRSRSVVNTTLTLYVSDV